ncbi:MAG: SDR family oxidoreductase [Bacteroidales bacterium]
MIFVTGGTGFIGAHFLFHLLEEGKEVIALRRSGSNLDYVKKVFSWYTTDYDSYLNKINWVEGNIDNLYPLYNDLNNVDLIIHLAAMVSFDPSDKYKMLEANIQGTANMVDLALEKGIPHFIYVSSVAALDPEKQGGYITEEAFGNNPIRNSAYGESKFKSELEVWRGIEEGLNALIVSPSVVLGPGLPMDGFGRILSRVKKGLKYYPSGITGFVDVRDVCMATWDLYKRARFNERFILSEGNYSYKEILTFISKEYGVKPPYKPLNKKLTGTAWRLDGLRRKLSGGKALITKEMHASAHNKVYFTTDKIRKVLNYEFVSIPQSVKDMIVFTGQNHKGSHD